MGKLSAGDIRLDTESALQRTIKIRQSDLTTGDIQDCNNAEKGVVVRTLKREFGFDYVWMGSPFTRGLPQGNHVECWKGGDCFYARVSAKFTRFLEQVEALEAAGVSIDDLMGGTVNTLVEPLVFYRDLNAVDIGGVAA